MKHVNFYHTKWSRATTPDFYHKLPWSLAKIGLLVAELRGTVWNIDFYLGNQIFYWTSTVTLYSCTLQPITLIFCIQTTLAMGFLCCKFHTHCFICLAATGVWIIFHLSPTFFHFPEWFSWPLGTCIWGMGDTSSHFKIFMFCELTILFLLQKAVCSKDQKRSSQESYNESSLEQSVFVIPKGC